MNKKNKKILTFFIHKIFTELSTTYSIEIIGKIRVLHIFHKFLFTFVYKIINTPVNSVKNKKASKLQDLIDKTAIILL